MSVQALFAAFKVRGLTPAERLTLYVLADHANQDLECYPRQDRLAEHTELSSRTIWTALMGLQLKGYIQREKRYRADGTRSSDLYRLLFLPTTDPLAKSASSPSRKSCESQSQSLQNQLAKSATQNLLKTNQEDITFAGALTREGGSPAQKPSAEEISWYTPEEARRRGWIE